MKTNLLKFVAAASALSLLAGCIVLSVYPFYTPNDLVSDPGLAGRWVKATATNEFWQFTDAGDKLYLLTTVDSQSTNGLEAHLFRLRQYQFLDMLTTNRDQFQMPVHLIAKVKRTEDSLSLQFMVYDWLTSLLTTNPAVLRHLVVPEKPGDTNGGMMFLTAETKDLQKFLLKHADDTNAFGSDSVMDLRRQAP